MSPPRPRARRHHSSAADMTVGRALDGHVGGAPHVTGFGQGAPQGQGLLALTLLEQEFRRLVDTVRRQVQPRDDSPSVWAERLDPRLKSRDPQPCIETSLNPALPPPLSPRPHLYMTADPVCDLKAEPRAGNGLSASGNTDG